jgi:integrase
MSAIDPGSAAQEVACDADQIAASCARHQAAQRPYQEVFDSWAKTATRRATTVSDYQKVLDSFAHFVQRKELALIARRDVLSFRDDLASKGQSPTTITRKVGILKTLFRVGIDIEALTLNPADQVRTARCAQKKARLAFTDDDLTKIFDSAIYTSNFRPIGGGKDACFWLPLLALFTGARMEELAQLLVSDIHHEQGLGPYLNITDEAAHGKLKNAASRRRIPLHSTLLDCGFLEYAESVRDRQFLFPALKPNPRQKLGGYFSNFFSGYLRHKVRITDKRKVFHSFRHTFKDICRNVGIDEAIHDALTGHSSPSAGRKYGNEQYPLAPLFAAMEQFEVKGLDLSRHFIRPPTRRSQQGESKMISAYYGIVIVLCQARSNALIAPFVFARCQGAEVAVSIADNQILSGVLPFAKQVLVHAWIEIHREELIANWETGRVSGDFFRVDPLR